MSGSLPPRLEGVHAGWGGPNSTAEAAQPCTCDALDPRALFPDPCFRWCCASGPRSQLRRSPSVTGACRCLCGGMRARGSMGRGSQCAAMATLRTRPSMGPDTSTSRSLSAVHARWCAESARLCGAWMERRESLFGSVYSRRLLACVMCAPRRALLQGSPAPPRSDRVLAQPSCRGRGVLIGSCPCGKAPEGGIRAWLRQH